MKRMRLLSVMVALGVFGIQAFAQPGIEIEVNVTPGTEKPVPVNLSGFSGEALEVIQFDLYVQGFKFTAADSAQYLLSGSNNGNLIGQAVDRVNKSQLVPNRGYTGGSLRRQAHAFVDDFLKAISRQGIGGTRIAFKSAKGSSGEIAMADFDGANLTPVTSDGALVAAPEWIPNRMALVYTSYKSGNPNIYSHDLTAGVRRPVAEYPGSNMSPSPSPNGSKVAMVLSKGGAVDLYVANADGSGLRQLTRTREDDSAPCWSPDGQWICFATKINERRALCKVPVSGGPAQRIATSGVSNPSEPDWSPDGKWIVFTAQMGGFSICAVPATGGSATVLVDGEDPSWSPNSRTVVYARRGGGRYTLSLLDVPTKQTKDISRLSGSNSQPSWAR
jgi:TolB protein